MAFVPTADQTVWFDNRRSTAALVLAVDTQNSLMWARPVDGGRPITVAYSDRWSVMPARSTLVDAWFLAGLPGPGSWSRAFFTRVGALAAQDANSIAIVHVSSDGTVDVAYFL